jgi:hypothetical protein
MPDTFRVLTNDLLSEIGPADTGGVLFVGICATPEEVRAVEADRLANTT